jgi:broad specificity phosphatase PhoE
MSKPTQIHLVRHGHVHNPRQIVYGRLARFRLSAKGINQARTTARFFISKPIQALFSSPLLRARQTANELRHATQQSKIRRSQLINEIYSPFQGRPSAEADALGGDVYSGAAPEFEQPVDIVERTLRFFKRVKKQYPGQHVVAVTHGDVIVFALLWASHRALDPRYKGRLHDVGMRRGYPDHGSVTTFRFDAHRGEDGRPGVIYWETQRRASDLAV